MKRAAALLALSVLTGCATVSRPPARSVVEVDAEGWAAEKAGDPYGPRARALADAQKRAVEKAAGVRVTASTRVEAGIAVRQRVWADVRGRVERWELVDDKLEDGFRKMRIRAVVRLDAPGEEPPAPPPLDARVRVDADGAAAEGLRRALSAAGCSLVRIGEQYVVTARAESRVTREKRLEPFVSGRARLHVSVRDAAGVVLWEGVQEAAELDADPLLAVARADHAAGERAGREAAAGLAEALWNH